MEAFVFLIVCALQSLHRNLNEPSRLRGRRPHNLFRSRYEYHPSESESDNTENVEIEELFTMSEAESAPATPTLSPSSTVPRTVYYTVEDANETIEKINSDKRKAQENKFARRVEESVSKSKSDSSTNTELCIVCIENVPSIRFSCCTHMLCEECMVGIWKFSERNQKDNKIIVKCPYCREDGFVRKFRFDFASDTNGIEQ